MATSRIADSVGRVLGDRYRLTRPLGTGASAHVYVAEDVTLRRRVAIKLLHPALAGDEGFLRRFRAEAQVVAALRHPNILTVFDWGEDGGSPYLVMELLEGGSLRSVLDSGLLLSPSQAAAVGVDAARALDYAHRRGLVHRDIKPANLIFDDEGRVTVADFGLARALAEATWTEPAGAVVGTARYAAPEQVRGERLDNRADVYALALVLVEATTGTVPFASDTTLGTLMARIERSLSVPDGAGALRPALEAAGTVDPSDRLDAAGLANQLARLATKLPPPAPLPRAGPLSSGHEARDPDPTEYPGRPRLFDVETAEQLPVGELGARPVDRILVLDDDEGAPPAGEAARRKGTGRRRVRRLALAVAFLLLLGSGVAVGLKATGALTPSHAVPVVVGDTQAQATAALRPLHLRLRVAPGRYSSRPRGTVIAQDPATGRLKEGQTVTVVMSLGPQPVVVPDNLAGLSQGAAVAVLRALGLKAGGPVKQSSTTVRAGYVISSSPRGGTLLPGQTVTLTVSTGKPAVRVPTLSVADSSSFAAAKSALSRVHLIAVEADEYSDNVPRGQVIGTAPGPGSTATVGSKVTVRVSKGPHLVVVPPVAGLSVSLAAQVLEGRGFTVSGVTGNPTANAIGTNPPDGSYAHYGSAVQIITG